MQQLQNVCIEQMSIRCKQRRCVSRIFILNIALLSTPRAFAKQLLSKYMHDKMFKNLQIFFSIIQIFLDFAQTQNAFEFKKNLASTTLSSAVLLNGPDIDAESFVICSSHYQKQFNSKVYTGWKVGSSTDLFYEHFRTHTQYMFYTLTAHILFLGSVSESGLKVLSGRMLMVLTG